MKLDTFKLEYDKNDNDDYQFLYKSYSYWWKFGEYYKAKKSYYSGKEYMSDKMFDQWEENLKQVGGIGLFNKYSCVGYSEKDHKVVINLFEHADFLLKKYIETT